MARRPSPGSGHSPGDGTLGTEELLKDGSRAMTGALDMGTNAITNVGNVDGRDVSVDGTKLDGVEAGADVTDFGNVSTALAAATGAVSLNGQAITSVGNVDGRDVSADGTKLDGIESGAEAGLGSGDPGANGLMARTALDTTSARTITGTASAITVTNGDGVSGNPTLDIAAGPVKDLADIGTETKGDIYVNNGGTLVRLGVGTDTHVLTADSAEASGVKWAAASGGGSSATSIDNTDSPYTVLSTDTVIVADSTSANITVTLPTTTGSDGRHITVVNSGTGGNTVNLNAASGQYINGREYLATDLGDGDSITVTCAENRTEWIGKHITAISGGMGHHMAQWSFGNRGGGHVQASSSALSYWGSCGTMTQVANATSIATGSECFFLDLDTSTSSGNDAYIIYPSQNGGQVEFGMSPGCAVQFRTGPDTTSVEYGIGFAEQTTSTGGVFTLSNATPARGHAALRFMSGDTNWHFECGNGTSITRVDTGVAFAANTAIRVVIQAIDGLITEGVYFAIYTNGSTRAAAETRITTNIPDFTQYAEFQMGVETNTTAVRTIGIHSFDVWSAEGPV